MFPLIPQEHAILDMVWGRCNEGLFSTHNTTSGSSSNRKSIASASASGGAASSSKNSKLALAAASLSKGFKMFFTQTILVPPNRFRPAAKIGEATLPPPSPHHVVIYILKPYCVNPFCIILIDTSCYYINTSPAVMRIDMIP